MKHKKIQHRKWETQEFFPNTNTNIKGERNFRTGNKVKITKKTFSKNVFTYHGYNAYGHFKIII